MSYYVKASYLCNNKKCENVSRSVVSDSLWPHGLQAARLLCPWNSPGQNTGVGSHYLVQGIFPTQGWNPGLLNCRRILHCLSHQGRPAAAAAAAAKSLQSCPTLCDPIDGNPPGSPVPGILQARTLEWVAISFSNAWKWKVKVKSLQSCPTLSDPMDCILPDSCIHGIFQARVLEWAAIKYQM